MKAALKIAIEYVLGTAILMAALVGLATIAGAQPAGPQDVAVIANNTTGTLIAPTSFLTGNGIVTTSGSYANPGWITSLSFSKLTALPTSAAGYGITNGAAIDTWGTKTPPSGTIVGTTDTQTLTNKSIAWSEITGTPTSASGYGITNGSVLDTFGSDGVAFFVPATRTVNGHALSGNISVSASDVGLGSVTNNAQTQASIVPNTVPSAGQILVGNSGGTAYAAVSLTGDSTLSSAGLMTNTKLNGVSLAGLATGILVNTTTTGAPSILGYTGGSLSFSGGNLTLSGDAASPGNSYFYGTNSSGTKGWYAQAGAGTTTNSLTFNNGGSGASSGSTFNGASAVTVSYNTIGAQAAGNYITALTGDVTASGPGSVAATVARVNGVTYGASPGTNTVAVVTGTGATTYEAVPNAALANSSITIAGTATSLGGSITLDTIDNGLSSTGLIKRTGANTRAIATAGTDYQAAITFGTGELAALGYAINSANGLVGYSGALGTPTSGTLTNCTFPTLNQNTTGIAGSVVNALTLNNSNSGASSGATFNGSAAVTLSANTLGAGSLANTNTWTQTNTFNVPPTINSAENNEGMFAKVVSTNGFLGVVNGSDLGPTAFLEDNGGIGLVQILTNANTDNSGINIESGVTGGSVYTVTFKASASVTETFPSTSFTAARTDAAQTFTGKQTFSPTSTLSGLNVGSYAGNPSSPANGDLWYNSTGNVLNAQINGSTVSLGSGGGGAVTSVTSSTNLVTASPTTGAVVITMPAPDVQSGTSYAIPAADVELIFTGSSAASYAMPSSPASNAVLYVKNAGTAALTLTSSANFFTYTGGFGSLVLEPGDAAYLPYGNSTWIVQ